MNLCIHIEQQLMIYLRMVLLLLLCAVGGQATPIYQKRQALAQYIQEAAFAFQPAVVGVNLVPYRADQDIIPAFTVADAKGCHWMRYQNDRWQEYDLLPPFQAGTAMTACRFATLPTSLRSFLWISYFTNDVNGDNMVYTHEVIAGVIQRTQYQTPFALSGARAITWIAVGDQDDGVRVGVLGQNSQPWYHWDTNSGSSGAFVLEDSEQLYNVQDFRASAFPNATEAPAYWLLFACMGSTCPVRAWDGSAFTRLTVSLPGSLNSVSGCAWGAQNDETCALVSMVTGEGRLYCLEGSAFIFRGTLTGPGSQTLQCVDSGSAGLEENLLNNKLVWHATTGFTVQYSCDLQLPLSCAYSSNTLPGSVELEVLSSFRVVTVLAVSDGQQTVQVWIDTNDLPPIYGTLQLIAPTIAPNGVDSSSAPITVVGESFFNVQALNWGSYTYQSLQTGTYTLLSQISNNAGFCATQYFLPDGETAENPLDIFIGTTTSIRVEYHCPDSLSDDVNGDGIKVNLDWLIWLSCLLLVVAIATRVVYSNNQIVRSSKNPYWAKKVNCGEWLYALFFNKEPDCARHFAYDTRGGEIKEDEDAVDTEAVVKVKKRCEICKSSTVMQDSNYCKDCCCSHISGWLIGVVYNRCRKSAVPGFLFCDAHNFCTAKGCTEAITVPGTQACDVHLKHLYCAWGRESAKHMMKIGFPLWARDLVCNEFPTHTLTSNMVSYAGEPGRHEARCDRHGRTFIQGQCTKAMCEYAGDASYSRCMNQIFAHEGRYCEAHLARCAKEGCAIRIPVADDRCSQHAGQCIYLECSGPRMDQRECCGTCYIQNLTGGEEKKQLTKSAKDRFCHQGYEMYGHTTCGSEDLAEGQHYCREHMFCKFQKCKRARIALGYYYCIEHACPIVCEGLGRCRYPKRGSIIAENDGCQQHLDGCERCYTHHDYCPKCQQYCPAGTVREGEWCALCQDLKRLKDGDIIVL